MWTIAPARRNSCRATLMSKSAKRKFKAAPSLSPRQSLGRRRATTCQIVGGYNNGCTIPLRPVSQWFSDLRLRSRFYNHSRRSACASANIRKKRGKCRHCVAVLPVHEVLNALDIRVATKRCVVERRACHLSDQEDTPLKEGNRIAKIRSPRHERIG